MTETVKRKRTPQTSIRKAIAYIRRTRWVGANEREAIRLLREGIKRCDAAHLQACLNNLKADIWGGRK